ncbi:MULTISPECIES: tyrosine--tRNA ligase [unclassified Spirosoma]|uniref:tyrosine--tRNA ligase n=1 Tax=unclassified Spirosoma TaxID=2621999 RepID=UPI000958FA96|nr:MULTISPECIES: tyrosine--tRNA ligase [unclassified Spirosoma]MBN8826157.1 tyrosine--tRNA ligase [Spirosoma sp.]OJW76944.1 MAG: tyrosine--tRNA ligase [Spirosoma sp. 48-14]
MNFIEELRWRGMLNDMTPGTEEQLQKGMTSGYIGFDPTAASLHIGNLATIMLLVHLQRAGHKPFALVGGATGMIGDPSGRSTERDYLSEETLRRNQEGIRAQLARFLNFDSGENAAEMVNNYDWFKGLSFLDFLREAGQHITVNYMVAKDSVKKRLETGLSFMEFSYQLLQGYDFYWLYKNKGVRLQMGGSDQWGNITTGTELIRRKESGSADPSVEHLAYALTTPLITKADGTKFGKSAGGNVWLDPAMTSPYQFYQFWLNASDDDCPRLIRVFTLLPKEEIEELERQHAEAPHLRILQKAIAKDVTIRVHSQAGYDLAVKASEVLFGKATLDTLRSIASDEFDVIFEGVPQTEITADELASCKDITDLLSVASRGEVYASKGEARRAISQNAVSLNKIKVSDPAAPVELDWLQERYILVSKGKKNHLLKKV